MIPHHKPLIKTLHIVVMGSRDTRCSRTKRTKRKNRTDLVWTMQDKKDKKRYIINNTVNNTVNKTAHIVKSTNRGEKYGKHTVKNMKA